MKVEFLFEGNTLRRCVEDRLHGKFWRRRWVKKCFHGHQWGFGSWFSLENRFDTNNFLPRSHFLWRNNLLWWKCLLSVELKMRMRTKRLRCFEKMRVFLYMIFLIFRRMVLKKNWRWRWESWDLLDWRKDLLNQRHI